VNTTSYVVFLTEIHTALVSRGAYKQIIGALIYSKKYMNIPWSSIRAKGQKIR
jgi:hypothetical protein